AGACARSGAQARAKANARANARIGLLAIIHGLRGRRDAAQFRRCAVARLTRPGPWCRGGKMPSALPVLYEDACLAVVDKPAALRCRLMGLNPNSRYLRLCRVWLKEAFTIDHPLVGGPGKPQKKPATTHFRRLATGELAEPSSGFQASRYALLECTPVSGRFRQIRRHLKHASHHLIGDTSHGDGRHNRTFRMRGVHRMLLHAWTLG